MEEYLLNIVKEKGIVSLIMKYNAILAHIEKNKEINKEIYLINSYYDDNEKTSYIQFINKNQKIIKFSYAYNNCNIIMGIRFDHFRNDFLTGSIYETYNTTSCFDMINVIYCMKVDAKNDKIYFNNHSSTF